MLATEACPAGPVAVQCPPEKVHAQLLKAGTRDGAADIDAVAKGVNLHSSLLSRRQEALCPLTCGAQAAHAAGVVADVNVMLALELLQGW